MAGLGCSTQGFVQILPVHSLKHVAFITCLALFIVLILDPIFLSVVTYYLVVVIDLSVHMDISVDNSALHVESFLGSNCRSSCQKKR